jgi:putative Holliday junction resolvase
MAREAAGFAGRLRKHIGLPVELVDERLSSWEATEQTHAAGNRSAKPVDELAAAVILRDYLTRARAARPEKAAKER